MVLHNSKWDRRAKARYLKKHGLQNTPDNQTPTEDVQLNDTHTSETSEAPDGSEGESAEDVTILPLYPAIDEQDPEEKKLIYSHFAAQKPRSQPGLKSHMISTNSLSFDEVSADVDRSKLDREVSRKLGKRSNQVSIEEDDDFEAFMNIPFEQRPEDDGQHGSAAPKPMDDVDKDKQAFLDNLLR